MWEQLVNCLVLSQTTILSTPPERSAPPVDVESRMLTKLDYRDYRRPETGLVYRLVTGMSEQLVNGERSGSRPRPRILMESRKFQTQLYTVSLNVIRRSNLTRALTRSMFSTVFDVEGLPERA
ncbi:hypothetical protein J6590_053693 [Homalodisca vitripennis]|nr:hypothetical protein J6590_053693 [Homalodisca vitripennis]